MTNLGHVMSASQGCIAEDCLKKGMCEKDWNNQPSCVTCVQADIGYFQDATYNKISVSCSLKAGIVHYFKTVTVE